MFIIASGFTFPIQSMQHKQISLGWKGTILMPIDTTLNSEPSQRSYWGMAAVLWLKQRSLHQILALNEN